MTKLHSSIIEIVIEPNEVMQNEKIELFSESLIKGNLELKIAFPLRQQIFFHSVNRMRENSRLLDEKQCRIISIIGRLRTIRA